MLLGGGNIDGPGKSSIRERWLLRILTFLLLVSLAAVLAYSVATLHVRLLDDAEADLLFEASRIREGRSLYIDPLIGTGDYGQPPTRYYVLYLPIWSWIMSWLPATVAADGARALVWCLWFGFIVLIPATAPPSSRGVAWLAAIYVAGVFVLALFGTACRPDTLAVCVAGFGLLRTIRQGRTGFLEGVLFCLAAWVKPNVIGLGAGAFLAMLWIDWRAATRTALGALTVSIPLAVILQRASAGAWISHLLLSTAQSLVLTIWVGAMLARLPMFAGLIAFAFWCGFRGRRRPAMQVGLCALATSSAWTLLSLAKIGSASNYWMEPSIGALVLISYAEQVRLKTSGILVAIVQVIWTGTASVEDSAEGIQLAFAQSAALGRVRSVCGATATDVVMGEDGPEMMLNGRIIETPFQFTHLIERGLFPVDLWLRDIANPAVRCFVARGNWLERPSTDYNRSKDGPPPAILDALRRRFVLVRNDSGLKTYRARSNSD